MQIFTHPLAKHKLTLITEKALKNYNPGHIISPQHPYKRAVALDNDPG